MAIQIGIFKAAVLLAFLGTVLTDEQKPWACEPGWIAFSDKDDIYCLMKREGKSNFQDAHDDCVSIGASLVSIHSKEKDAFVRTQMKPSTLMWIGLKGTRSQMRWIRKDGYEEMDYSPPLRSMTSDYTRCGMIYDDTDRFQIRECYYSYTAPKYFCEKRAVCDTWHFGPRCDKKCHCHGSACDPQDLTGTCQFGCQRGWMGPACDKAKLAADVTYYCVNSTDHGTYVHIKIDTKGVTYRNIHGLNSDGMSSSWCSDTAMVIGRPKDFINIKVFMTPATIQDMNNGTCAGKIIDDTTYQWPLVIQERKGILMKNDQQLMVTCNFTQAETLSRSGIMKVRGNDETPVIALEQTHEEVTLEVADAFTGLALTSAVTGSPVRLQMRYGLAEGSLVKGIVPYNCEATSGDGKQRLPLLDKYGCQESDLVSAFSKPNTSNHIHTEWFPFFGFEGSATVLFRCSFTFCFVECETGCDHVAMEGHANDSRRVRRSAHKELKHSVVSSIRVIHQPESPLEPEPKPKSTSPQSGREDNKSYFIQWSTHWFYFVFTISIIILVLIVYAISIRSLRSSITDFKHELRSTLHRVEISKNGHSLHK